MSRVRALLIASHQGPSLAITAMATLLAAEAAPHGIGPVLVAPAMLAGQFSVGWSNDVFDAGRDDFIYFSYATLTTVGYGDLVAATNLGRSLAITEALLGQIYLVTVVALIVGNLRPART